MILLNNQKLKNYYNGQNKVSEKYQRLFREGAVFSNTLKVIQLFIVEVMVQAWELVLEIGQMLIINNGEIKKKFKE